VTSDSPDNMTAVQGTTCIQSAVFNMRIGQYNGAKVAIKYLPHTHLSLSRDDLVELKTVTTSIPLFFYIKSFMFLICLIYWFL